MPTITKLLIANRGEIARRITRTARAMDIATVAVHSDPDRDAPHVREADESVALPGSTPRDTYLDIAAIIRAAHATGADAVHPGYGFLSENAEFARACSNAGLVFVGPTPEVIEAMGSKLAAKDLMARAGVPILPGATIDSIDDVPAAIERVGLPVLVKAAFGGGGRGMRVVRTPEEAVEAVAAAQREAASAFGNGTVFLERYLETPRHIEVQIFGDTHGNVIHLFERECSVQRRYQKIVEEAPSPVVDDALRRQLGDVAVRAAQALGYVGAGTVEFVMDTDRSFYFLEVNTRLQVEHPVTEMITGLDLVELQLRIARGEVMPDSATNATINGHAIEVRLYAEDVPAGYLPVSGDLLKFEIPAVDGLRVDSGYENGSHVSTFYDAMLAKVICWAPDRTAAAQTLAKSLSGARLHGPTTNRDLLVRILRHPEFLAGDTDTAFLTRNDGPTMGAPLVDDHSVHALAAALAAQASRRGQARVQSSVTAGFRNVPTMLQQTKYRVQILGDTSIDLRYGTGPDGLNAELNGQDAGPLTLWSATPSRVDLTYAGVRRVIDVDLRGDRHFVDSSAGFSVLHLEERFPLPQSTAAPGSLLAGMPGTVVAVPVAVGDVVEHGHPLIVLEAMKMEHSLRAPHRGIVVELHVGVGDQVAAGALLAVVEEVE
jgi:propionyl-CoA carboxylase alpha chain